MEDVAEQGLERPSTRRTQRFSVGVATGSTLVAALALYFAVSARSVARHEASERALLAHRLDSTILADEISKSSDSLFLPLVIDGRIESWAPTVDLHASELQNAGGNFEVGNLGVAAEPGGARISGVLVNEAAVGHTMASFRFSALGISRDFTVKQLPSGGSSHFSVDVPGLPADSARFGTITLVSSTIHYRAP